METIWNKTKIDEHPELQEDLETEVLVIGGGICGVLCAYYLSKNHQVVLVEANRIAGQRTRRTTAVITALQDINYSDLSAAMGKQAAKDYLNANLDAIEEYAKLSLEFDFDFERVSSYKYYSHPDEQMVKELKCIESLRYPVKKARNYIEFQNQAQMNPLKLIQQLTQHFTIYENTKITAIHNQMAYTKDHHIQAKYIVVATGYPFLKLKGLYPLKLTQKKSFVATIAHTANRNYNCIGANPGDLYFRTYQNSLLIGGNDQKTGKTKKGYLDILNYIEKNHPNEKVTYQWVNQDCVTLDGLPYIGNYGNSKTMFVATGFNLWGMTGSMIAARLIQDKIEQKKNPYSYLFHPKRHMPVVPLLKNISTVLCNFVKLKKRCSHLGCALYYNENEGMYECPCHGTKYTSSGEIIFNPAQKNIDIKK